MTHGILLQMVVQLPLQQLKRHLQHHAAATQRCTRPACAHTRKHKARCRVQRRTSDGILLQTVQLPQQQLKFHLQHHLHYYLQHHAAATRGHAAPTRACAHTHEASRRVQRRTTNAVLLQMVVRLPQQQSNHHVQFHLHHYLQYHDPATSRRAEANY